jgi:hypothetical protein
MAIRAGVTAYFTAEAFNFVATATLGVAHQMPALLSSQHLANMAGHALVGCLSAMAGGAACGPGALSAAAGSFAGPILKDLQAEHNLVAHAVVGGLASVAGGGNFANGAVTASFGYLFNEAGGCWERGYCAKDAVSERRIQLLHPELQEDVRQFLNQVYIELGIELRVAQGFRSSEQQGELFALGRTKPGKTVTDAPPGTSYHEYGLAIDVVGLSGRAINWNIPYKTIAGIAEDFGLQWGGLWIQRKDMPHFQRSYGMSIPELRGRLPSGSPYPKIPGTK